MQSSPRHQVSVRNRREPLIVYAISDESRLLSASGSPNT
jgi:hypothetical protein